MQLRCELRQCPVRDVDRHDEVVLEVDRHDEVVELELRQCPMHRTSFSNVDRHDEVEGPFGHVWQLHAAPPPHPWASTSSDPGELIAQTVNSWACFTAGTATPFPGPDETGFPLRLCRAQLPRPLGAIVWVALGLCISYVAVGLL